jgi:hypothetical protein
MKKKRLKRELRALAESHKELERAHRKLARHAEVIAVAVHSPAVVPPSDLQAAISGIHELTSHFANQETPARVSIAA